MIRERGTGGIGPVRLGSAIIGATILLRADAEVPQFVAPQASLEPPPRAALRAPLLLPAPGFGATSVTPQAQPATVLPPPDPPPLKQVLLAEPSRDVIAVAIATAAQPYRSGPVEPAPPVAEAAMAEPQIAPAEPLAAPVTLTETNAAELAPEDAPQEALPLLAANDDVASAAPAPADIPRPTFGTPTEAEPAESADAVAVLPSPPPSEAEPQLALVAPQDMAPLPETGHATPSPPATPVAAPMPVEQEIEPVAAHHPAPDMTTASSAPGSLHHAPAERVEAPAPRPMQDDQPGAELAALVMQSSTPQTTTLALPVPAFGGDVMEQARSWRDPAAATPKPQPAVLRVVPPGVSFPAPKLVVRPSPPADAATTALTPAGARPGAGRAPEFSYDDELVLQIRTADGMQGDTLIAYGTRSGVYLPLGAMARFLDLAIAISDDGNFASGWFLDEKRRLTLDLRQGELTVESKALPLAPEDAAAFEGELYLRAERFAEIFPLELKANLRDQSVTIRTLEPFPFEERLAREAARDRLDAREAVDAPQKWPREETPWKAFSFPMADVELRAASDQSLGDRMEGDLRLAGDVAFMTGQAFLSGSTSDGLTGARLSLGRQDPDANLLGPLGATEFQLGDVSSATMPLGLRGTSGRGLYLTNQKLEQASVFDRVDLRGSLPDGYEVELYRNNILVGSTRRAVNGQYEFLQVPVEYGLNVLRLVFYGPQGQRREEVRRISVGDGRLAPGQLEYSFGAVQKDVNLFGVRGPDFSPSQDYGAWRYSGQLSYGLTAGLTASLGGAWFESETGKHWLANAGLRAGIAGMAARIDVAMQDGGAKAYGAGLGGKLLGMGFRATHLEYRGAFIDEVRAFSSDPLRRATEIDLDGSLSLGGKGGFSLPLSARFRRIEKADGRKETDAMLRGSARVGTVLVSNTLDYSRSSSPGLKGERQLLGSFDLATLSGSRTQLRGSASYEITPKARLVAAGVEIDHEIDDRTSLRASVNQGFVTSETLLGLSASRRLGKLSLAFDGSYGLQRHDYSFLLRLGFSFGRNPLTGGYFLGEPGLASSGVLAMRAFRDSDGDGRFGEGDAPLQDITFVSGSQQAVTDKDGLGLMGGLPGGTRASFQVDTDSLPDIALAPATRGKEIVPRPGRIHVSDFAIEELSDIEGTAWFGDSRLPRGVSGLSVMLVDRDGKMVRKVRSEADGFYLFEQLKPGLYRIEIDPEQARRLGIHMVSPVEVEVKGGTAALRRDLAVSQK